MSICDRRERVRMNNVKSIFVMSGLFVLMAGFLLFEPPLFHMTYAVNNTFLPPIVDPNDQPIKARIIVNGFAILADVAITDEDQIKGLSIRDQMNENEGMLFVYGEPSRQSFWMKDMKFPIDIIWLNGTGSVVHVEENLKPCVPSLECPSFSPNENAQYVLETVAGFAQKHHLKIGTDIDFSIVLPDKS
ncbi:MAG TPA: DUF192 domain-containing protein [Nitrososphaeraceae archaeon]